MNAIWTLIELLLKAIAEFWPMYIVPMVIMTIVFYRREKQTLSYNSSLFSLFFIVIYGKTLSTTTGTM
jgi:hypothetical protein